MTDPCRTTQHCAYHGWCNRCDPALAKVMDSINAIIQRECTNQSEWGTLYEKISAILHTTHTREAETVSELNKANIQMARELAARNAQLGLHVTRLQLEQQRVARIQQYEKQLWEVEDARQMPVSAVSHAVANVLRHHLGNVSVVAEDRTEKHVYLSTGCLHDNHEYCQSMTGIQGSKRGGKCKHCDAQCVCTCHTEETA